MSEYWDREVETITGVTAEQRVAALQQEIARLRDERDRYKQIAEDAVAYRLPAPVIVDIGLRQRAESAESSLLALREALEASKNAAAKLDDASYAAAIEGGDGKLQIARIHSRAAQRLVDAALSITSAQAEGIKARLQAQALNEAAEEMPHIRWKGWLRARAAQLTDPAVAKEKP